MFCVRNFVEVIDSAFSAKLHRKTKECEHEKDLPGYEKEKEYENFVDSKILMIRTEIEVLENTMATKYIVRYEDLLNLPTTILCEIITFINNIPCHLTLGNRINEFVEKNGLVSSYKVLNISNNNSKKNYTATTEEIFKRYPKKIILQVYGYFRYYNNYFKYAEFYLPYVSTLEKEKILNNKSPDFRVDNRIAMENIFSYTTKAYDKKKSLQTNTVAIYEEFQQKLHRLVKNPVFDLYRKCSKNITAETFNLTKNP